MEPSLRVNHYKGKGDGEIPGPSSLAPFRPLSQLPYWRGRKAAPIRRLISLRYTRAVIPTADLRSVAQARLDDADALLVANRFDGSIYICGYAVEIALKARICDCLKWPGYPGTNAEFRSYTSFRTHNLDVLLHLSGAEAEVKTDFLPEWSTVVKWDPDARYRTIGSVSSTDAATMLTASRTLVGAL